MLFNIKLDTTSDYMFDERKWPKASCDVMVECDAFVDIARLTFGKEDGDGYVDSYAVIDPERRLVTEFLIIFKDLDGSQDDITVKVTDIADSVEYFKKLEDEGGDDFGTFIAKANVKIHGLRCEMSGNFIDVVDDFLEERDVRIPTSDKELKDNGEWNDASDNAARIYGSDYDELIEKFEKNLDYGLKNVVRDRLCALGEWQQRYLIDEHDFYDEIFNIGFTKQQLIDAWGKAPAEAAITFFREHGYI
nr:hypothetical protein [uncultured Butyrivibrio sp.]